MRTLIGTGALLVLTCGLAAAQQNAVDAKKLIGEWDQPGDAKKKVPQYTVEIAADGRSWFKEASKADGEYEAITQFTYTVAGNKVTMTRPMRDGDLVRTFVVTKLTEDVLEATEEETKMKFKFSRLKGKPAPSPADKK